MSSDKERIRKAVNRALQHTKDTGTTVGMDDWDDALHMVRDNQELPNHIIGKIPVYLEIMKELVPLIFAPDRQRLVEYVLSHRAVVYDDHDFMLYLLFISDRNRLLGQQQEAEAIRTVLETVMHIGLLYG